MVWGKTGRSTHVVTALIILSHAELIHLQRKAENADTGTEDDGAKMGLRLWLHMRLVQIRTIGTNPHCVAPDGTFFGRHLVKALSNHACDNV